LKLVTLLILAVLAAVVLYQLYAVLGRRVGRQPEDVEAERANQPLPSGPADEPLESGEPAVALTGLAALRARDPSFDVGRFMAGARSAYEMIVIAFAERDRETLEGLLAPKVMEGFERVMAEREAAGETETVEFIHPPRGDLETITVDDDTARIKVRFLAEHRHRTKGPEGESVDDRRTAEAWTFERNLTSRDPNWILVRVDAAEA
jgi:predicted lipid-binding transport protein (Tim44 family)